LDSQKNLHDPHMNGNMAAVPPVPPAPPTATDPEPEPGFRQWLERNGFSLVVVGALLVFLFMKFDGTGLWAIAKAALGLSFVVFIHELGHFLVAKWCDVHVTAFSIGFGPPIPGCWFQWGETTYKLALFPLGGYVQMVGQVDGDEGSDGSEDDPRSYRNKSVGQRMAIISAGVVMNVILAVICFIVVFQGPGKDRRAAVIDSIEAGSPASTKGLRTGAVITQVGDYKDPYFENLMTTVMGTVHGQQVPMVFKRPQDADPTSIEIEPRLTSKNTRPVIGILPAQSLSLEQSRLASPTFKHPVTRMGAAAKAEPPFEFDDRIIATTDPDNPKQIKDLPLDPRKKNSEQRDYFEFARRLKRLAGKSIVIRVERGKKTVDITVPPTFHHTFGARLTMGEVTALRENGPAATAGIQARDKDKRLQGDIILGVEVNGKPLQKGAIDPLRLPFDLQQWADALYAKKSNPSTEERTVVLRVRRHRTQAGAQFNEEKVKIVWDHDWRFDRIVPFVSTAPLAIPELGLAFQVRTTVVAANAAAGGDGLQKDDVIKKVQFHYAGPDGTKKSGSWVDLEPEEMAWVFWQFQMADTLKEVSFEVQRGKETKEILVQTYEDKDWPLTDRGLVLSPDVRRQKADNIFQAVALGLQDTHNLITQVYQNLRGMATGRISVKNLGGPVMIAEAAYRIAGYDFWEFVFFIGMISVNLAVINFLPIPVLDGGHMVFLLYEKIRGKPASEGVRVGATYAGLALILSIMIFVLYQDISRLFRG